MIIKKKLCYSYMLEEQDREAIKKWLKNNNLILKDIYKDLDIGYIHLCKIMCGLRNATSKVVNKLRKMGVKFPQNHHKTITK